MLHLRILAAVCALALPLSVFAAPSWAQLDKLIKDQKLEEASRGIEARLEDAKRRKDEDEWAKALVRATTVRIALHGYETSVRFLREQRWPEAPLPRGAVNLTYAYALIQYTQAYGYELRTRERVETKGPIDLKAWSHDQVIAEAHRALAEVWSTREALGRARLSVYGEYLEPGTYPSHIRGTVRDAVTYLMAQTFADSGTWSPAQENELFRIDVPALVRGGPDASVARLTDASVHPLLKAGAVLSDLEAWHAEERKAEAAMEARLERVRILSAHLTAKDQRVLLQKDLADRLKQVQALPWFAMGKAVQADLLRQDGQPIAAHRAAREGHAAYPASVGGQRCLTIQRELEAPEFQLASMASDGLDERSVQVSHRNVARLYFRAYQLDLDALIAEWKDYSLIPQGERLHTLVARQSPVARWSVDLPQTEDFESHVTYVTPPLDRFGLYIIAASAREDFAQKDNQVMGAVLNLTTLVMLSRQERPDTQQLRVLDGRTGKPVVGAVVELYRYNWRSAHERVGSKRTDRAGYVTWTSPPEANRGAFFSVARHGDQRAFDPQQLGFHTPPGKRTTLGSFVYTDRSVYRPNQSVRWKVVAYEGDREGAAFRTVATKQITVGLYDGNNQLVESVKVGTNGFGSAAGEFRIPTGRVLGAWSLRTDLNGWATVRVEEYKRPTFEVELLPAAGALRLNKPATLKGKAGYYFGQPVTAGAVRWQVIREPRYPWWWSWYRLPVGRAQTIAARAAALREDGTFEITFTPEAEEGVDNAEVSYSYKVTAELTDEGGETRSATRHYRIGRAAIEARLDADVGFFRPGAPIRVTLRRTDLDGEPRPGAGRWRLVALRQPSETLLPADEPWPAPPPGTPAPKVQTAGDKLRPRWTADYQPERTLRAWAEGRAIARGELAAGAEQVIEHAALPPGAYRLIYETDDGFGTRVETQKELVVGGPKAELSVPLGLWIEERSVAAGGTARLFIASGLPDQPVTLEIQRQGRPIERRALTVSRGAAYVELPVGVEDRGGIALSLSAVRDHQLLHFAQGITVPYDHKDLQVEFSTFRDQLQPGGKETFRVTVNGNNGERLERGAAEVLAYMYDKSLDYFAPHTPVDPRTLYQQRRSLGWLRSTLGQGQTLWLWSEGYPDVPRSTLPTPSELKTYSGYGVGGFGRRREEIAALYPPMRSRVAEGAPPPAVARKQMATFGEAADASANLEAKEESAEKGPAPELRSNFAETAFFFPQLRLDAQGGSTFEFEVPDSVTAWNVWAHAITRDLRAGSVHRETRSVKELMVRPYLPRFFREGDEAELQVVVNNTGRQDAVGEMTLAITDTELNQSALKSFLAAGEVATKRFSVPAGKSGTVSFRVKAPRLVRTYSFEVTAKAGQFSDGERRPVPVLPGRLHLAQSRFVTLHDRDTETMRFDDLARDEDPSLVTEKLVVTVDAQLFYTALQALPYLINYPYECTEQTLNRFVSSGIVSSLYRQYPAVAQMAKRLSARKTQFETWDAADPNRRLLLEESPYLQLAKGGAQAEEALLNVLDPRIAKAQQESALAAIRKMQTASGGFPWFPGGRPSPYMTVYLLHGFARAAEYGVPVPKDITQRAWGYVAQHYRSEYAKRLSKEKGGWEFLTFLNYVATAFPDASYTGDALTLDERRAILDFSFKHWREHSPYLKGYLSLTLKRMGRAGDAKKVFASVMDSAKTTPEDGTYWAPEERGWLWYNDRIESHAFALRVLMELEPKDARRHGLVQWLLINKQLNHWRSTRATAEVVYALVKYLEQEGALGIREEVRVAIGPKVQTLVFEPDEYTGKRNQIVLDGPDVDPKKHAEITVSKTSKGFAFASASWHFATDKLPVEEQGDLLHVSRRYFRREKRGTETVLQPLQEGAALSVGDELEVQLSIRARHAAEFIHLKDPRAAGLEPDRGISGYRYDQGLAVYEETRDSATNFFIDWLPAGEFTLKYRLRANMAGTFRVGPATLQSMYAPEFNAYSTGHSMSVRPQH